jgi:uncharacterized membrane protein YuzA (DUF378 family)
MLRNISPSPKPLTPWGWIAGFLTVVGALNWGMVGLFNFNLVRSIFGPMSMFSRLIYALVGLSGLYLLFSFFFEGYEEKARPRGFARWWR